MGWLDTIEVREGRTRVVSVGGGVVAKLAQNDAGRRRNLEEAEAWRRGFSVPDSAIPGGPVIWCSADGELLIAEASRLPLQSGAGAA